MSKPVIPDELFARFEYLKDTKSVFVNWKGKLTKEQYIIVYTESIQFSERTGLPIHRYLFDIRNQVSIDSEVREWLQAEGIPMAINNGIKRGAIVFDGNVFLKFYPNIILKTFRRYNTV